MTMISSDKLGPKVMEALGVTGSVRRLTLVLEAGKAAMVLCEYFAPAECSEAISRELSTYRLVKAESDEQEWQ